jgi:hypothetical protein
MFDPWRREGERCRSLAKVASQLSTSSADRRRRYLDVGLGFAGNNMSAPRAHLPASYRAHSNDADAAAAATLQ